jgi:hypothetical protein
VGKEPYLVKTGPAAVKYSIIFLISGWLCHYAFYFMHFAEDMPAKTTYLQLGVGIGICFFVTRLKRWARMLCLFFNIGIIGLYGLYSLAFLQSNNPSMMMLTLLVTILFILSTYFLLRKETAQFFAAADPDVRQQNDSDK